MQSRIFENWTYEEVEEVFGIVRLKESYSLQQWIEAKHKIPPARKEIIDELREYLLYNVDSWNEDELRTFFISPFMSMVHYIDDRYKVFTQRTISATFPELDWKANGRVEWLISKGKVKPKQPFFCIHEYKSESKKDSNPLGQLLIAMVVVKILGSSMILAILEFKPVRFANPDRFLDPFSILCAKIIEEPIFITKNKYKKS